MASIELYFIEGKSPELQRIRFSHPSLEAPILSVRGKSEGAYLGTKSFQWTPAVRALAIFFLRAKARFLSLEQPLLSGEAGSPAASLDYALSKQTSWLFEMFGWNEDGQSLAKTFILRTNPNRKRPGPVSLSLCTHAFCVDDVQIFVDEREIDDCGILEVVANQIEASWQARNRSRAKVSAEVSIKEEAELPNTSSFAPNKAKGLALSRVKQVLRAEFRQEIINGLVQTDIFDRASVNNSVLQINENPSFKGIVNKPVSLSSPVDDSLAPSERLGVADSSLWLKQMLCQDRPLKVATAVSTLAANAIFLYLKHTKGYHIELNHRYVHALEISNRILRNELREVPDICVMAMAPAASMFSLGSRLAYHPLMFFPKTSHRLIAPKGADTKHAKKGFGRYLLLQDEPSSASFYFDDLERQNFFDKKKQRLEHKEPFDALGELKSGDPELRSVMFFPYHSFNRHFNNCRYLDDGSNPAVYKEMVLLVHQSLWEEQERVRALNIAVRDAWIEIRGSRMLLEKLIGMMLDDDEYFSFLSRSAGLYHFDGVGDALG